MQFSRALNDARVEKEAAIAQAVAQAKAEKMEAAADERQEQLIKVTGKTTHSFFEWQCVWFIYLLYSIGIFALGTIEILALWLVEDASYLILIPPCKVVIVGMLNLKMAALHFVNIRLKVVMQ